MSIDRWSTTPFEVLLYDMERYGGERRAPESVYPPGGPRFSLNAYMKFPGQPFPRVVWTATARTYDEIRRKVPDGGVYFDRTGNRPSPMVPIEGWRYSELQPPPDPCPIGAEVSP